MTKSSLVHLKRTVKGEIHTADWLGLYEGPFAVLCFADADLSVLSPSLQDRNIRTATEKSCTATHDIV